MKVAIFSGRFDPPHIGHVLSILKIAKEYDHVIVPILDYPHRFLEVEVAAYIFKTIFNCMDDVSILTTFIINHTHFANITVEEYNDLIKKYVGLEGLDITYLSGNFDVLNHMNKIGIKNEYFERSMDELYTGTIIKGKIKNGENGEFL